MKKNSKKRYKIKIKRLLILMISLFLLSFLIYSILNVKIKNIFISGNTMIKDQEIIETLNLENYPTIFKYSRKQMTKKLKENELINDVKITKRYNKLYIEIDENYPILYNINTNKYILKNKLEVSGNYDVPTLINYIPNKKYKAFIKEFTKVDMSILSRISEIEYQPNEVDDERFVFKMIDDNYVYITINKLENINNYMVIVANFPNKKGILYLDSGEYFKIINN